MRKLLFALTALAIFTPCAYAQEDVKVLLVIDAKDSEATCAAIAERNPDCVLDGLDCAGCIAKHVPLWLQKEEMQVRRAKRRAVLETTMEAEGKVAVTAEKAPK